MNSYGSYASQLGLDTATPLNKQNSLAENRTWEQYMLESATENLADSYALGQAAAANGYQLSEENEQMIASITDENGEFIQEAKNNGYDTADAYLQANFGGGHGCLAAAHGHDVPAVFGFDAILTVHGQGNGPDRLAVGADLDRVRLGGILRQDQRRNAAQQRQRKKQQTPMLRFHGSIT